MTAKVVTCGKNPTSHCASSRIIYPLLIFFKMIGLLTPSIASFTTVDKRRIFVVKPSTLGAAYNVLLIVLTIGLNFLMLSKRTRASYPGKTWLVDNIEYLQTGLAVAVVSAILLSCCFSQKSLTSAANQIAEIPMKFARLGVPPPPRTTVLRRSVAVFALNSSFFVALLSVLYARFITEALPLTIYTFSYWMLDMGMTFFIGCCAIEYFMLITLVDAKFAEMNAILKGALDSNVEPNREGESPQSSSKNLQISPLKILAKNVVNIRGIHSNLWGICNDINNTFSVSMLVGLTYVLVYLTYTIFFFAVLLAAEKTYANNITISFLNVLCLGFPMTVLMFAITILKNKVGQTAHHVHNLLNCTNDPALTSELTLFSLQLIHEKPQFTACGFFNLDCSLLQGIVGAVTTYMVILIQFSNIQR